MKSTSLGVGVVALGAALLAASCSSTTSASSSTSSHSGSTASAAAKKGNGQGTSAGTAKGSATTSPANVTTTSIYVEPPVIATPTTIINGQSYVVPRETPSQPISGYNASGSQIIISPKGILPFNLFAPLGAKVTWTNLTSSPVSLSSYYQNVNSGPIPPGGTFVWTSATQNSIRYHTSNGFVGRVEIGAFPSGA